MTKPRLFFRDGWWVCAGAGFSMNARTPRLAYWMWRGDCTAATMHQVRSEAQGWAERYGSYNVAHVEYDASKGVRFVVTWTNLDGDLLASQTGGRVTDLRTANELGRIAARKMIELEWGQA